MKYILFSFVCCTALTLMNREDAIAQVLSKEKTTFQIAAPWKAAYDIRSDVAIVYGINDAGGDFEERVKGYRDKGYEVQFMTGIAWGQYQDYFTGKLDGISHMDEGQMMRNGETIWHGKDVPYIVPTTSYLNYMKSHVRRAIDAGVTAVYLEEPEFWARAGYSDVFKKEWVKFYGFPWKAQHESPEATYLSSKLKYQLYFNALKEVFSYVKSYSESKGKSVKCYVPTHSLLNYSAWEIVSPEASLANLEGMDGYIAQVWTGTSREPLYFNGIKKERVFENAFLEYGSMVSMTASTGRKIFFLTDPIEDRQRSWEDYKVNYQATFTAQLLYPMVNNYEVMPWPSRIYEGKFKVEGNAEKQPISPDYATQMQVMVNSLNAMPLSGNKLNGSHGVGILLSNSMMFQRFPVHAGYDDPQLSNFYGMALPLLERGIPVETVHMENLIHPNTLKDIRVLVMSYANMKPLSERYHEELAAWVKRGGVLIYYGRDNDPFQSVNEWWNNGQFHFKAPSAHLFSLMGIEGDPAQRTFVYGRGKVLVVRQDPKELVMTANADHAYLEKVREAYEQFAQAGKLIAKNNFVLRRGPYIIAAVLAEAENQEALSIKGPVIDLFDPALPVLESKSILPGTQAYLYDLSAVHNRSVPQVLAAAARVYAESIEKKHYSFIVKSPSGTQNIMRILLPSKPIRPVIDGPSGHLKIAKNVWDEKTKTLLLQFENYSEGVTVDLRW
ncbi:hypothetical protein [Pedobacter sp.]|jgi:hypothetical protein|uniref:hypothetical protein n=1 Tax=Pedobacter sp. TaxID=1411316 RepID=UPI002C71AD84|nr:hypothetical protein [Pedobacter sp.]HWW38069.1 hypothetical protein [Pedobacter sp.]